MGSPQSAAELLSALLREKYQIIRGIGRGGMASVYLARHRITGGYVAVKVLADHLARDPQIVARFSQEAKTAATLAGHPNIVNIFDVGQGSGLHYLVMEYVAGEDVASLLKRQGHFSPSEAANVIGQVANALSWACSRSIVHRDLKPSNLILDRTGRVVVLDFGIAKAQDGPSRFTKTGERLGTLSYMSPEQIRAMTCDVRSDLYSLGVIFFELLAGMRPFHGESERAIEMAHLAQMPPDLHTVDGTIPTGHKRIVERLLAKDPTERYQTPADLLADLNQIGMAPRISIRPIIIEEVENIFLERTASPDTLLFFVQAGNRSRERPAGPLGMKDFYGLRLCLALFCLELRSCSWGSIQKRGQGLSAIIHDAQTGVTLLFGPIW